MRHPHISHSPLHLPDHPPCTSLTQAAATAVEPAAAAATPDTAAAGPSAADEPPAPSAGGEAGDLAGSSAITSVYQDFHPLLLAQMEGAGQQWVEYPTFDAALDEFFSKVGVFQIVKALFEHIC